MSDIVQDRHCPTCGAPLAPDEETFLDPETGNDVCDECFEK